MTQHADNADKVDHPAHYNKYSIEAVELIAEMGHAIGFCIGNAMKYLMRADHKGATLPDWHKAAWYLNWIAEYMERPNRVRQFGEERFDYSAAQAVRKLAETKVDVEVLSCADENAAQEKSPDWDVDDVLPHSLKSFPTRMDQWEVALQAQGWAVEQHGGVNTRGDTVHRAYYVVLRKGNTIYRTPALSSPREALHHAWKRECGYVDCGATPEAVSQYLFGVTDAMVNAENGTGIRAAEEARIFAPDEYAKGVEADSRNKALAEYVAISTKLHEDGWCGELLPHDKGVELRMYRPIADDPTHAHYVSIVDKDGYDAIRKVRDGGGTHLRTVGWEWARAQVEGEDVRA